MRKRDFLAAGLGLSAGLAASSALSPVAGPRRARDGAVAARAGGGRGRAVQTGRAKTTRMFRAPGLYPNGLAVAPEGLWIGQQKVSPSVARDWNVPCLPTAMKMPGWSTGTASCSGR